MSNYVSLVPPPPLPPPPHTFPRGFSRPQPDITPPYVVNSELKKPLLRLGSPLILPQGYECVILTGISSVFLLSWKSMKVSEARKECILPSSHSENSYKFNCVQRALHSTLEIYPQFLFLLLIGGLEMPYFSSVGGLVWILGRFVHATGYYSGDPENRSYGSFYWIGHCMLLFSSLRFAYKRWIKS